MEETIMKLRHIIIVIATLASAIIPFTTASAQDLSFPVILEKLEKINFAGKKEDCIKVYGEKYGSAIYDRRYISGMTKEMVIMCCRGVFPYAVSDIDIQDGKTIERYEYSDAALQSIIIEANEYAKTQGEDVSSEMSELAKALTSLQMLSSMSGIPINVALKIPDQLIFIDGKLHMPY